MHPIPVEPAAPTSAETLLLTSRDGYPLTALRYPARVGPDGPHRGHLILAGATGVPQLFYKAFAEYAAGQGYTVLTLDYRGIGLSRPHTLRGFRMAYLDWAHQDLAAAVDAMTEDGVPLFMVGHSFGGHAFGLLPNHERVARFYTFATGAGWAGWMPPAERIKVTIMWRLLKSRGADPADIAVLTDHLPAQPRTWSGLMGSTLYWYFLRRYAVTAFWFFIGIFCLIVLQQGGQHAARCETDAAFNERIGKTESLDLAQQGQCIGITQGEQ